MALTGDCMGHDWILDVLTDLRTYSHANGLLALAAKVEEALRIARLEILAVPPSGQHDADLAPPHKKAH